MEHASGPVYLLDISMVCLTLEILMKSCSVLLSEQVQGTPAIVGRVSEETGPKQK
jgi:hypothetical protein